MREMGHALAAKAQVQRQISTSLLYIRCRGQPTRRRIRCERSHFYMAYNFACARACVCVVSIDLSTSAKTGENQQSYLQFALCCRYRRRPTTAMLMMMVMMMIMMMLMAVAKVRYFPGKTQSHTHTRWPPVVAPSRRQ